MKSLLAFMLVGAPLLSWSCPKVIAVSVTGLTSVSSRDTAAIGQISQQGDHQTSISYIASVLESVNNIRNFDDTLKLSAKSILANSCTYVGSRSKLVIERKALDYGVFEAILSIGRIDYRNQGGSPSSHQGYSAQLVSTLSKWTDTNIDVSRSEKPKLVMELDVQIPLGDYGTDGFTETVQIGQAQSVAYKVLQ